MSRENEGPRRGTEDRLEADAQSIVCLSRAEIAALGFEPTRRGWRPLTEDRDCAMRDADERGTVLEVGPNVPGKRTAQLEAIVV